MDYLPSATGLFGGFGLLSGCIFLVYGLFLSLNGGQSQLTVLILGGLAGVLLISGVYLTMLSGD